MGIVPETATGIQKNQETMKSNKGLFWKRRKLKGDILNTDYVGNPQNVLVSVIIPIYCAQKTLPECLESVLTQSLNKLEVICVDDGSTDDSLSVLEKYATQDSRICIVKQATRYAGVARNNGLEKAVGKYVAFLDADDILLPGALEFLYCHAEKYQVDMIKAGFEFQNVENSAIYRTPYSEVSCINSLKQDSLLSFNKTPDVLLNVPDMPWNGLYRRAFLEENGIRFNHLRCVNDHSFYISCMLNARRIKVFPTPVVRYRVGETGSLITVKANRFEDQITSYNIVRDLCREIPKRFSRKIMAYELNVLLGWYEQLKPKTTDPVKMEKQIRDFLFNLNEDEVGKEFFHSFSHRESYYQIRYGRNSPPRGSAITRALRRLKNMVCSVYSKPVN